LHLRGEEHEARFATLLAARADGRRVFVLGERKVFAAQGGAAGGARLVSTPATPDYNGLVAVVPAAWSGRELAAEPGLPAPSELARAAVVTNPLVAIGLHDGAVRIDD